jgi:HEAT repeat protein
MPLFGPPNIEKLKEKGDLDGLTRALRHKYYYIRRDAAEALGELGHSRAVEPLVAALKDEDTVRKAAVQALAKLGSVAVHPLIAALDNEEAYLREAAAVALGELRDPRAVEPLVAYLHTGLRGYRPATALEALGEFADPRLAAEFADYIDDGDLEVRGIARGALGKMGDAARGALIAALKDGRSSAARALVVLGIKEGVAALVDALHDENHLVRAEAASALGHLGDARAVNALVSAVADEDPKVRAAAAEALASLATRERVELIAVLRPAFETLLGILNQEIAELKLEPSFPASDLRMKLLKNVAVVLGEVRDERAVETLAEAFELAPNYRPEVTTSDDILEEAAMALAGIGQPSVRRLVPLLGKFERDTDVDRLKRAAVIEALQRIGGPEAERALTEYRARQK